MNTDARRGWTVWGQGSTGGHLWRLAWAMLASVMLALSGCGGGGSDAATEQPNAPTPQVPQITQQAQSVSVVAGTAASFLVQAQGTGTLSYQWYRNGTPLTDGSGVSGATGASLQIANVLPADNGAAFHVVVSNSVGQVQGASAALSVTLPAAPQITQQVVALTVEAGATAQFSVAGTGDGALSVRWYRDGQLLADGGAYSGVQTSTLSVTTSDTSLNGAVFRAVVVDRWAQRSASADATLTVREPIPALVVQSVSGPGSVTYGGAASFSASAAGGVAPLQLQWQRDGVDIPGATGASYSIARVLMADNGATFGVKVTDARGEVVSSGAAQRVALQVTAPAAPAITTQSQAVTVTAGATATFSVAASGVELSYQWYRNGVAVAGATSATYSFTAASADNGAQYHAVVTDGVGQTATSQAATLTVSTRLAGVTALGAPLSGASVKLIDAAGHTLTTTADENGNFSFDVTGLTAPFQLIATVTLGDTDTVHYAVVPAVDAGTGNTANITPLTTAIAGLVAPTDLPTTMTPEQLQALTPEAIAAAADRLKLVIAPLADALGLPANFNPLTTPFNADGTGADRLLDHIDVAVSTNGVAVANKMAVAVDGQSTAAAGSTLVKGDTSTPTPVSADATDTQNFDELAQRLQACFAIPAGQRLVVVGNQGTLHSACAGIATADYLHNGQPFMNRFAGALNSATQDGATYSRPVVRLRLSTSPERIAVNLNFKDNTGAGYTRPEVIERQGDGRWLLVGNRRAFNGYAEAQATYMNEMTPNTTYVSLNGSRVDTGFRLAFDPRSSFDSSGNITYNGLDLSNASGFSDASWASIRATLAANQRMVGCVVVRGPGEKIGAKWSGFHPNGLLLKRPTGSTVQDYLAIDNTVSDAWRTAINATTVAADGSVAAPTITGASNICGGGTTSTSSSSYVVDAQALGARKNLLTGQQADATIAGRDVAWNTGPRFARLAPTGNVKSALEANPPLTFEVFDTDGRLRAVMQSRFLGRLPDVGLARAYVESRQVPEFSTESLARYLDFSSGAASVSTTVTGSVQLDWTVQPGAMGADRIGLYSEIQRSIPGEGLRGPLSRAWDGTANTNSLWTSDPDLAAYLDGIAGRNFWWWNSGFAQPNTGAGTSCSGSSIVSTNGVNVPRSVRSVGAESAYGGSLYGTDALSTACLGTATHAYVYRELFFRTYTDQNVRLYVSFANRAIRAPAP